MRVSTVQATELRGGGHLADGGEVQDVDFLPGVEEVQALVRYADGQQFLLRWEGDESVAVRR